MEDVRHCSCHNHNHSTRKTPPSTIPKITQTGVMSPQDIARPPLSRQGSTSQSFGSSWSSMKRVFSSTSIRSSKASTSGATTPNTADSHSMSRKSSIADSPELQGMLMRKTRPDLAAVDRALEELKLSNDASKKNDPYISHLQSISAEMGKRADACREQLRLAMQYRSEGRPEMCRGLCWQITQADGADVRTQIYAFNILATQAADAKQARNWLDKSQRLVNAHLRDDDDGKKLNGIIAMLREHRRPSAVGIAGGKAKVEEEEEEEEKQVSFSSTVEEIATLKLPTAMMGAGVEQSPQAA